MTSLLKCPCPLIGAKEVRWNRLQIVRLLRWTRSCPRTGGALRASRRLCPLKDVVNRCGDPRASARNFYIARSEEHRRSPGHPSRKPEMLSTCRRARRDIQAENPRLAWIERVVGL